MKEKYCTLKNSKLIWKIDKITNNKVELSMNNKKITTTSDNILTIENYTPDLKKEIKF